MSHKASTSLTFFVAAATRAMSLSDTTPMRGARKRPRPTQNVRLRPAGALDVRIVCVRHGPQAGAPRWARLVLTTYLVRELREVRRTVDVHGQDFEELLRRLQMLRSALEIHRGSIESIDWGEDPACPMATVAYRIPAPPGAMQIRDG